MKKQTKTKTARGQRAERLTTPAGIAVYPYLSKPDTKFDDEGKYKTKLHLDPDEAEELMTKLQEEYEKAYREECNRQGVKKLKVQGKPWRNAVDEDGKETGALELSFSSTASGVNKETKEAWTRTIPIFDAKRKPINTDKVIVGPGSTIKVAFFVSPYYNKLNGFGVSLRILGVQVIDLVKGGGKNPEAMGFGDEDGWEGDDSDTEVEDTDADVEGDESEDEELDLNEDAESEGDEADDDEEEPAPAKKAPAKKAPAKKAPAKKAPAKKKRR